MECSILRQNFIIVDDDRPTVDRLALRIPLYDHWSSNPIVSRDGPYQLEPRVHVVGPSASDSLESFMESVRDTLFGSARGNYGAGETAAAALHESYLPSSVFLVDWKFDKFSWDYQKGPKPDGLSLCREIKRLVPHGFCCLVTAHDAAETTEVDGDVIDYSIAKATLETKAGESLLAKEITKHFSRLLESPTWDGLLDYAGRTSDTFHAMALGGSGNASPASEGFLEKFGANLFAAEASLTLKPLDSLLSPSKDGCIAKSQTLFARAFGARRARFATNGTSGANAIMWSALFNEGDLVLVDRNCHISHHYAAARQGVTPIYLEPQIEVRPDVFGPPAVETIVETIREVCAGGLGSKLRGIVLTNCTFDGNLCDAGGYIERIDEALFAYVGPAAADKFVYFFDEAWFSFARFDPGLIRYTAMYAADIVRLKSGNSPRVYATQSVHKTLTAFRQASVILEHDAWPNGESVTGTDTPRFKQSFLAHTTTSPSALIVASFDIARRQMCVDGAGMITKGARGAADFIANIEGNRWPSVGRLFATSPHEAGRRQVSFPKDPTKVTLFHRLPVASGAAKKMLWDEVEIQVNKFGVDSVMFMFMPGYDKSKTRNVLSKLRDLASRCGAHSSTQENTHKSLDVGLRECVDRGGAIKKYPMEVAASGGMGMGRILFGSGSEGASMLGRGQIDSELKYICCSFITPYPPGYPVMIPGQVVSGKEILGVLDSDDEIHGVEDGRILLKPVGDRAADTGAPSDNADG